MKNNLNKMRHSTAHLMACVVKKLYPNVKIAIGPIIENGFYYDFEFKNSISEKDLLVIENKMKDLKKENLLFTQKWISIKQAKELFKNEKYKLEIIKEIEKGERDDFGKKGKVSIYKLGEFTDLCKGPHLKNTKEIGEFKLLSIAGAYWKGNEKNKMLTRIYGTCFETKNEIVNYLKLIKEAEKRNHVKLGKKLEIFLMHEEAHGFPFILPKGMIIWHELIKYWKKEHDQEGYLEIKTPIMLRKNLWKESGHWDHYKENIYFTKVNKEDYAIKPMNCPGSILIYKNSLHSYRELPLRMAEIGLVHRHELSGVLNGLFRVRSFHQDDAHIYCMEKQIKNEVIKIVNLAHKIYKTFKLDYRLELSTRPKKSIGSAKMWQTAENALSNALKDIKGDYKLNPGDGAFYGPKIDFHIQDALGRSWQCGTIQLDFAMPERFKLVYTDKDSKKYRPVMIHHTIYGAIERFLGILIEHYTGAFPLWLSPVQVDILPISEKFFKYAQQVHKLLKENDILSEVKPENKTLGSKIRTSTLQKTPYMIIIGEKENKSFLKSKINTKIMNISVRTREGKDLGLISFYKFINKLKEQIEKKV